MESLLSFFLLGVAGGFVVEFLGLFKLRKEDPEQWPKYLKRPIYWAISIGMMIVGGGLVILYMESDATVTPVLALNIGASAPLILQVLTAQAPDVSLGRID